MSKYQLVLEPGKINLSSSTSSLTVNGEEVNLEEKVLFFSFIAPVVLEFALSNGMVGFAIIDPEVYKSQSINEHAVSVFTQSFLKLGQILVRINFVYKFYAFDFNLVRNPRSPLFIGHRGAGTNALGNRVRENTILSFNRAMDSGPISGIELDVLLTRDNQLVVYHDLEFPVMIQAENASESTRLHPIADLDYADLCHSKLTKQVSFDGLESQDAKLPYLTEDLPLLKDVLKGLKQVNAGIVIEIKYPTNLAICNNPALGRFTRNQLVQSVLDCLDQHRSYIAERWIIISSFDPDICLTLWESLERDSQNLLIVHNISMTEDSTVDFTDVRNFSPAGSALQAKKIDGGIAMEAHQVLRGDSNGIDVPILSYGKENMKRNLVRQQLDMNVLGIFADRFDMIKYST